MNFLVNNKNNSYVKSQNYSTLSGEYFYIPSAVEEFNTPKQKFFFLNRSNYFAFFISIYLATITIFLAQNSNVEYKNTQKKINIFIGILSTLVMIFLTTSILLFMDNDTQYLVNNIIIVTMLHFLSVILINYNDKTVLFDKIIILSKIILFLLVSNLFKKLMKENDDYLFSITLIIIFGFLFTMLI